MIKFYKNSSGNWQVDNKIIPAGSCLIEVNQSNVSISFLNGRNLLFDNVKRIQREDGTAYASVAEFLEECSSFFVNPLDLKADLVGGKIPDNQLNSQVVKIGEITFEDLNSADLVKYIDILFTAKKPAGKEIECLYFKNVERFLTSEYSDYEYYHEYYHDYQQSNRIIKLELKENSQVANISDLGVCWPEMIQTDIKVGVELETENQQNWIAGKIFVYARLRDYSL